ncbi:MAG: HAD family hydrolase, partial [Gammaproteobacteria bacterium]
MTMIQTELEALIFDVDGTLADTERDGHREAFNRAFKEAGLDWHWDEALYGELLAVTGGKERMRHYMDSYRPRDPAAGSAEREALYTRIPDLHKAKTAHYTAMLAEGVIGLRPGVRRLLDEARACGLRIAIATTTTPANVTALLENSLAPGSCDWFEVIAAGDIVPAKKPAPDIYHYAMEHMGIGADRCLAFEDSENGIRSSQGAGLTTLVTINGYTHDHDFTGAALVVDN